MSTRMHNCIINTTTKARAQVAVHVAADQALLAARPLPEQLLFSLVLVHLYIRTPRPLTSVLVETTAVNERRIFIATGLTEAAKRELATSEQNLDMHVLALG